MNTSQREYIERLCFLDEDRHNSRHVLASEFLLELSHTLMTKEAIEEAPSQLRDCSEEELKQRIAEFKPAGCIGVPVVNDGCVVGFADVLCPRRYEWRRLSDGWHALPAGLVLGEVKIKPQPAELVLQQIAFYKRFTRPSKVVIVVDYEAPALKRLSAGSNIQVFSLGDVFEEWVKARPRPVAKELVALK